MRYNFPKTKFVEQNTTHEQIQHILSEADELREEYQEARTAKSGHNVSEELCDLAHSIETLFRMDETFFKQAVSTVVNKNLARGYYDLTEIVTPVPKENNTVKNEYETLHNVLMAALEQAQNGKGSERHGQGRPFEEQPIILIPKLQNSDKGLIYQAIKKLQESDRMSKDAAIKERLGAINYIAASIIYLQNK